MSFFAPPPGEDMARVKPPLCREPGPKQGQRCGLYRGHLADFHKDAKTGETWR